MKSSFPTNIIGGIIFAAPQGHDIRRYSKLMSVNRQSMVNLDRRDERKMKIKYRWTEILFFNIVDIGPEKALQLAFCGGG